MFNASAFNFNLGSGLPFDITLKLFVGSPSSQEVSTRSVLLNRTPNSGVCMKANGWSSSSSPFNSSQINNCISEGGIPYNSNDVINFCYEKPQGIRTDLTPALLVSDDLLSLIPPPYSVDIKN